MRYNHSVFCACDKCAWSSFGGMKRARQDSASGPYKRPRRFSQLPTKNIRKPGPYIPRNIIKYQQTYQGGEIKAIDVIGPGNPASQIQWPLATFSTANPITVLNLISPGSSMFNRIGRKVSMKSIHIQGFFNWNFLDNPGGQFARIMVVYDKQTNGAVPNITDILQDQCNNTGGDAPINVATSGVNLNNRDRFEVITDRRFYLPGFQNANGLFLPTATADDMHVEVYSKLKGREVHFKADSVPCVIGDIATGSLLLLTFGATALNLAVWTFTGSIRLRYSDL